MIEVWQQFLATEKIPAAGKYICVICKMIVEITQTHIDMWKPFFACPICHSGEVGWPKWPEVEIWEYLGA